MNRNIACGARMDNANMVKLIMTILVRSPSIRFKKQTLQRDSKDLKAAEAKYRIA